MLFDPIPMRNDERDRPVISRRRQNPPIYDTFPKIQLTDDSIFRCITPICGSDNGFIWSESMHQPGNAAGRGAYIDVCRPNPYNIAIYHFSVNDAQTAVAYVDASSTFFIYDMASRRNVMRANIHRDWFENTGNAETVCRERLENTKECRGVFEAWCINKGNPAPYDHIVSMSWSTPSNSADDAVFIITDLGYAVIVTPGSLKTVVTKCIPDPIKLFNKFGSKVCWGDNNTGMFLGGTSDNTIVLVSVNIRDPSHFNRGADIRVVAPWKCASCDLSPADLTVSDGGERFCGSLVRLSPGGTMVATAIGRCVSVFVVGASKPAWTMIQASAETWVDDLDPAPESCNDSTIRCITFGPETHSWLAVGGVNGCHILHAETGCLLQLIHAARPPRLREFPGANSDQERVSCEDVQWSPKGHFMCATNVFIYRPRENGRGDVIKRHTNQVHRLFSGSKTKAACC
jgi:hypothetical protein